MTTLNPPEDIELAEELLKIHGWAGSVKFCRTGGESMSIAVRLSRAYTKKDKRTKNPSKLMRSYRTGHT